MPLLNPLLNTLIYYYRWDSYGYDYYSCLDNEYGATIYDDSPQGISSLLFVMSSIYDCTNTPLLTRATPTPTSQPLTRADWNGQSGKLLTGTCATPAFTTIDGPTVYLLPFVGCDVARQDCCPYSPAPATASGSYTQTSVITVTVQVTSGQNSVQAFTNNGAYQFPLAEIASSATLPQCPDDYFTVGTAACCPTGYQLWTTEFGGLVPCYSSLQSTLSVPAFLTAIAAATGAFTSTSSSGPVKLTSAIVNVVYAMQYPVQPRSNSLTTGAKAGVSIGSVAIGLRRSGFNCLLHYLHPQQTQSQAPSAAARGHHSHRTQVPTAYGSTTTAVATRILRPQQNAILPAS